MTPDDFQPTLGRIRSTSGRKNQRYLNRVVRDMSRAAQPKPGRGRSSFSGSRSGKGYSVAAAQQVRSFQPGRRRVVIKARFTRFKNGTVGAVRAHLRYIQRGGVTREGAPGELYGSETDRPDGNAFLTVAEGDRHQFRFIVAPEDSGQIQDLKPFIRDLMRQAEIDLGTRLDWVAVDHFNTGHPHSHIIVRGKDDTGKDLVIARDYLSHGFRERARDLVTLELGPETKHELDQKIEREVQSERFTRIDRSLFNGADQGVLTISPSPKLDIQWQAHRMGRLRKLESMGLAEELAPGVWKLADRTEMVLRQLGQRGDILKTMELALKDQGVDRSVADFAVFDVTDPEAKITGKIVGMGLSDEMNDRHYVLVDGTDGKLHYAEVGQLSKLDPPRHELLATLQGQTTDPGRRKISQKQACIFIESHAPFSQLTTADGATWLDKKLTSRDQSEFRNKGFGAEVNQALRRRQQWLVEQGLMAEHNGQLIAKRRMLAALTNRDIASAGARLEGGLGLNFQPDEASGRSGASVVQSVRLTSGRFAVVQKGKEFSLVPWHRALGFKKTAGISIDNRPKLAF